MTPAWLALAATLALGACGGAKKAPPKAAEDDFSKAFAELDHNDRDEPAASASKPTAASEPAAPEKPRGPVYPAPFTAEQIRDATKEGRTYRFRVEVPDEAAREYAITFRNVDKGGVELSNGSGKPKRVGWLALQQQSEFPRDKVKTRAETVRTPLGKLDCMVYELEGEDGEIFTYYFAKRLPGAPVLFYVERDGTRLRTTALVDYIAGR